MKNHNTINNNTPKKIQINFTVQDNNQITLFEDPSSDLTSVFTSCGILSTQP
jgi:hypothetical protein